MGEEIAMGILQEQTLTHNAKENLVFKFNQFTGTEVEIKNGEIKPT